MNADTEEEKKRKKENGIADRCDSLYFEDISRFETFLLYVTGFFLKTALNYNPHKIYPDPF